MQTSRVNNTRVILLITLMLVSLCLSATPVPAPPKVAAAGHLLIDFNSGHVLSEENAHEPLEPASLTKIMTAYVVLREISEKNINLSDLVRVSEKAWKTPGSRMFIEVNRQVSVEKLLMGMIIQSGNDASVALAEHVAGSEQTFAKLMNQHARRLGMVNTHFENSTGLPIEGHLTTAHDIAKVAAATIREFPQFYEWYSIKDYTYNEITQQNRNKLLWRDDSVDGIKTGHTEAAGYCLVASAKRNNMRLISVVMGTQSENARAKESQALLSYGFRFYETHRLYGARAPLAKVRVWKGDSEELRLGLESDLYITIPRGKYDQLKAGMNIAPRITAPVMQDQSMGKVVVTLNQNMVAEAPLIALEKISEGGIWQTLTDTVLLWLE